MEQSCPVGLMCTSFVNVYQYLYESFFMFGFQDEILDLIVLNYDYCLSIYFQTGFIGKIVEVMSS